MTIRKAVAADAPEVLRLLYQIANLHYGGRPDLFKANSSKYTKETLETAIETGEMLLFVAEETKDKLLGYAICQLLTYDDGGALHGHQALYLDDLCVDESARGKQTGQALLAAAEEEGRAQGCTFLELNVWCFNQGAVRFYNRHGYTPRSTRMEKRL